MIYLNRYLRYSRTGANTLCGEPYRYRALDKERIDVFRDWRVAGRRYQPILLCPTAASKIAWNCIEYICRS